MHRYPNKAFPSQGQQPQPADSFDDCARHCESDRTCVAFTFIKDDRLCRLMETTGEYFPDARADSGVKRQEPLY